MGTELRARHCGLACPEVDAGLDGGEARVPRPPQGAAYCMHTTENRVLTVFLTMA